MVKTKYSFSHPQDPAYPFDQNTDVDELMDQGEFHKEN
jgi:hypothetical protein